MPGGFSTGGAFSSDRDYVHTGSFQSSTLFGYANVPGGAGVGAVVTQASNRTTGVTINAICGAITTNSTSLAVETAAEFTVTNSFCLATSVVVVCQRSGANSGNTNVYVSGVANGSFKITVADNNAAAGTAETGAIIINFMIFNAVAA